MKIGTCRVQNQQRLFVAKDDRAILPNVAHTPYHDMPGLISGGEDAIAWLAGEIAGGRYTTVPLTEVDILAPIPRPTKNVMCLGWNYSEHIVETSKVTDRDANLPEHPIVFTKSASSVVGANAVIPYDPAVSTELDWEVELGVIIGKGGKGIDKSDALEHVFGYTVINDISARDLQFRHKQFFIGKSLDGACPMGPWIVTRDEIPDPQNLRVRCLVNDVVKQDSSTQYMIFDVATIISILSKGMTLEAGDIIATGTPDGVGFARKPPEFLAPGDTVTCEIENIGAIKNRIQN